MMDLSDTRLAIRYVDSQKFQRDLEEQRKAEFASKSGPSYFLSHGSSRPLSEAKVSATLRPRVVSTSKVAVLSALKLSGDARRAATQIIDELHPLGLRVFRGDETVARPFASKHLVHMCETTVCHIPYVTERSTGRLVVMMTNFASGIAIPTKNGICYKNVVPLRDTAEERNAFRVLGVLTDDDGRTVAVDKRFTSHGVAWSVESIQAITDACKRQIGKTIGRAE
jgi:hypothetical protein